MAANPNRPVSARGSSYDLHPRHAQKVAELVGSAKAQFWTISMDSIAESTTQRGPFDATRTKLLDLVAAVRASALPENLALFTQHSDAITFLSMQAMQEYAHLGAAVKLAGPETVSQTPRNQLRWPEVSSDSTRGGIEDVLEHAAIYAAFSNACRKLLLQCPGGSQVQDIVQRIVRDYERSYEFGLIICAARGTEFDAATFQDRCGAACDAVTSRCQAVDDGARSAIRHAFVMDIRTALEEIQIVQRDP